MMTATSIGDKLDKESQQWTLWNEKMGEPGQDLIGRRVVGINDDYVGTVRYVGPLPASRGIWFGVDWLEDTRGRHDGSHAGKRYFVTRQPTSGSFVRPNKVSFGMSFEATMDLRYGKGLEKFTSKVFQFSDIPGVSDEDCVDLETPQDTKGGMTIEVLGLCPEAMKVDWSRLRSVNMQDTALVALDGTDGGVEGLLPALKEMNLSKTLITRWTDLAEICQQLPTLVTLTVNDNDLAPLTPYSPPLCFSFPNVTYLVMVRLNYTWPQLDTLLTKVFPNLRNLVAAYNRIGEFPATLPASLNSLTALDLAGNSLSDFNRHILPLGRLLNLKELLLNNNGIVEIDIPTSNGEEPPLFPALTLLGLSDNPIASWTSITSLTSLPALDELLLWDNPLFNSYRPNLARSLIVARFPRLAYLNRSVITLLERRAADIDYFKYYGNDYLAAQSTDESREEFLRHHPTYAALVKTLGSPEKDELKGTTKSLKEALISLTLICPHLPLAASFIRRLPQRMTVHHLLAMVRRLFHLTSAVPIALVYTTPRVPGAEFTLEAETREIGFYDIESGDTLIVKIAPEDETTADAAVGTDRQQSQEGDFLTSRLSVKSAGRPVAVRSCGAASPST